MIATDDWITPENVNVFVRFNFLKYSGRYFSSLIIALWVMEGGGIMIER